MFSRVPLQPSSVYEIIMNHPSTIADRTAWRQATFADIGDTVRYMRRDLN